MNRYLYLTTRTQMTLPIIRHFGFPVANLLFDLQLFPRENLKLIILHRIFRRNTVHSTTLDCGANTDRRMLQ